MKDCALLRLGAPASPIAMTLEATGPRADARAVLAELLAMAPAGARLVDRSRLARIIIGHPLLIVIEGEGGSHGEGS